jgi:hypothetical protein
MSEILNSTLGLVIVACVLIGALNHQDDLSTFDRFILGGLAGSTLLTTTVLISEGSPFEPWAFMVSRGFWAAYCIRRFLWPSVLKWRYQRRHAEQIAQSAARLEDKRKMWL